jgi:hypothetical protein
VRSVNAPYGFSIVLPRAGRLRGTDPRLPGRLGAENGRNGLVYVCVQNRPKDFATSKSEFVNREQIKYIRGNDPYGPQRGMPGHQHPGSAGQRALYLRNVEGKSGGRASSSSTRPSCSGILLYA